MPALDGLGEFLAKGHIFLEFGLVVALAPSLLVVVDQQQVFRGFFLLVGNDCLGLYSASSSAVGHQPSPFGLLPPSVRRSIFEESTVGANFLAPIGIRRLIWLNTKSNHVGLNRQILAKLANMKLMLATILLAKFPVKPLRWWVNLKSVVEDAVR